MECLGGLQNHWDSRCLALIPAKFFFLFLVSPASGPPAAVPERRVRGEPRAVPEGPAELGHHLPEPHEEQPHARAQHHQRQLGALALPVHQQHAPPAAGHPQPAGREEMWVPGWRCQNAMLH